MRFGGHAGAADGPVALTKAAGSIPAALMLTLVPPLVASDVQVNLGRVGVDVSAAG